MGEEERSSEGWDGRERRSNPVRRLLFAREVRAMMRELGPDRERFRREDEPGDDDAGDPRARPPGYDDS